MVVWNLLDFAACTFPVTFADKAIDKARDMKMFKSMSEIDTKIQVGYDPDFYHGTLGIIAAGRKALGRRKGSGNGGDCGRCSKELVLDSENKHVLVKIALVCC